MFPHEVQAIMAKILLFVFATCILCFSKVKAVEFSGDQVHNTRIHQSIIK